MNKIEEYYNLAYDEWERLLRHRIEFEMTKRLLDRYIPKKASVLDVGGGPGRYSIYLAQKGCEVTLVDLCANMVEQAARNADAAGVKLKGCIKGNVMDLTRLLPGEKYDAVLCMGPMYHLLEEYEREEAIRHCLGLLKTGGLLVASFITAFAPMIDCLKSRPQDIMNNKESFLKYLKDGRYYAGESTGFTDAYFSDPSGIGGFMSRFELEPLSIIAAEGLGAMVEKSLVQLQEEEFQSWLDVFEGVSENPLVWGSCEHILYAGRSAK